jgi:hypothetical protein
LSPVREPPIGVVEATMIGSKGKVLLVGSVPLKDSRAVFHTLTKHLGNLASRYPDGETGDRINWIRWQRRSFEKNAAFERVNGGQVLPGYEGEPLRPYFRLRDGLANAEIKFEPLGYAAVAAQSFAEFRKLKAEGSIPADVRFQVSIPTPTAIQTGFIAEAQERVRVERSLEAAVCAEVSDMVANIPASELSVQWDVAHEVIAADGGLSLHYSEVVEGTVQRLSRLIASVPADVEVGIHLCYGDLGHRHLVQPKSAGTCVAFANAICSKPPRHIDWIHLPVPRDRKDDEFFEPLRDLRMSHETDLYLGLVHFTDGLEGTSRRIEAAKKAAEEFGIATECGFGRRDPATIPALLDLHAAAAKLL